MSQNVRVAVWRRMTQQPTPTFAWGAGKRVQALTGDKHSPLRIGAVGTHVVGFLSKGLLRKPYPLVIFPGCGTRIIVGRFVFRVQIEN